MNLPSIAKKKKHLLDRFTLRWKPDPDSARGPLDGKSEVTLPLIVFLAGLNLYYFLPFVFQTGRVGEIENTLRYTLIAFFLIFVSGILEVFHSRGAIFKNRAFAIWSVLLTAMVLWMVCISFISGHSMYYGGRKAIAYVCLITVITIGHKRKYWPTMNKVFLIHTFIGCAFNIYILLFKDVSLRLEIMQTEGYNAMSASLYAASFMFLTYPIQKKWGRFAGILSIIVLAIHALMINKRLEILMVPLSIILVLFAMFRLGQMKEKLYRLLIVGTICSVPILLAAGVAYKSITGTGFSKKLSTGIETSKERFAKGGDVYSTIATNVRWAEIKAASDEMSFFDWVTGKGVSATWSHPRLYHGEVRRAIHVSYFQFIFHGGIPFLILLLFLLAWVKKALLNSLNPLLVCCGAYIVTVFVKMASYAYIEWSLGWILFCICLGSCIEKRFSEEKSQARWSHARPLVHKYSHARR